jgi:dTDP-glucose 4,6-dehydratase
VRDHGVICVDNMETGSLANIEHMRSDLFRFVHADIIEPFFVDESVDFAYHLLRPRRRSTISACLCTR